MKKEEFDKLSPDQKFTIINSYQTLLQSAVNYRMGLLPFVAGISATLLVVATFNNELIPLDNTIRFVLSILFVIIPMSLLFYNLDLKEGAKKNVERMNELLGTNFKPKLNLQNKVTAYLPDFIIYILLIISFVVVYKIWCF